MDLQEMLSCFHFHLAVDAISTSTLTKMQANAMRKIKKQLGLSRSATTPSSITLMSSTYHLSLNSTPELSAISVFQDPMITELGSLLSDDSYLRSQGIPSTAVALLQKARNSVSSVGRKQMTNQYRKVYREHSVETWKLQAESTHRTA